MKLKNNCKLNDTASELKAVLSGLLNQSMTIPQAEVKVRELFNKSDKKANFDELLEKAGLSGFNFQYKEETPAVDTNIHQSLSFNNEQLFRYHDAAKNKMLGLFSHQVFKHLFVDRTSKTNPFITTPREFNLGVVAFKNNLVNELVKALNIQVDTNIFTDQGGNNEAYVAFLNHPNVGKFLETHLEKVLNNPLQDDLRTMTPEFTTFSNLYILENFDSLLKQELGNLITVDPAKFGKLDNTKYTKQDDANITTYWANDTYEDKGIKNYTSNLTKFILRQVPKMVKVGTAYKPITGEYLDENELYILSGVLKDAEKEYFLKYPDSDISFTKDTVKTFRTLLKSNMPAIRGAKRVLIDSLNAFLYDGYGEEAPIAELFNGIYTPINALDIESLIASEANQSYAPSYLELGDDLVPDIKNYNGAYQRSSSLINNLTDYIITQAQKTKGKKPSYDSFIVNGLQIDTELYAPFIQQNEESIKQLQKDIENFLKNRDFKEKVNDYKEDHDIGLLYNAAQAEVKAIINKSAYTKFKQEYNQFVSDRVITQFDTRQGTTFPVYRLESAITKDISFMKEYRRFQKSEYQNFFSQNPHLFSKYSEPNNFNEFNSRYRDSTVYQVSVGDNDNVTEIYKLNPSDNRLLSFLYNMLPMFYPEVGAGAFLFQPTCYSDKTSIGSKAVNLDEKVRIVGIGKLSGNKPESLHKLLDITNPEESFTKLLKYDWFYRKNIIFTKINNILEKWSKVFPDDDIHPVVFDYSATTKVKDTHTALNRQIEKLKSKFSTMTKEQLFGYIEQFGNEIEFNDELDYVLTKKGKVIFNPSLLLDFQRVASLEIFTKYINDLQDNFFNSDEYKNMLLTIGDYLKETKDASKITQLFLDKMDGFSQPFFKQVREKIVDPKTGKERKGEVHYVPNENSELNQVFKFLMEAENFFTFNYLDLVSKNYYLDPSKKTDDPVASESSSIDAMSKRMVEYPATIQQFQQNRVDGISNEIKIAVVTDPVEPVWNHSGASGKLKIYDGLGELSPFEARMEYNSLPGHGLSGIIKSLGVGNYGDRNTLLKWAAHPQTNEKMMMSRQSKFQQEATFRKMHSIPFGIVDVTHSWTDKANLYQVQSMLGRNLYFQDGLRYYRFSSLTNNGGNNYTISMVEVDQQGFPVSNKTTTKEVTVNNLYDLWKVYGGMQSMDLVDGSLIFSESSLDAVYQHIIYCGNRLKEGTSQDSIYQPLRDKFINVLCNQGAMKRGAANINSANKVYNPTDTTELQTFKYVTNNYGIQLDANHLADMEDIREMSQTISTIATLGYTSDMAQTVYDEIGSLIQNTINDFRKQLSDFEYGNITQAIAKMSKQLIARLSDDDLNTLDSFIDAFTMDMDQIVLPISDRKFYKSFIGEVIDRLNKSAIIRRYTGLAGILSGGNNLIQLYEIEGKLQTYPALLKEATAFFQDPANKGSRDNLEANWLREHDKDQDIVDYYIAHKTVPVDLNNTANEIIEYVNTIPDYTGGVPITTTNRLKEIRILDTISYMENGEQKTLSLDSPENLIAYRKLIQQRFSDPSLQLKKLVRVARDLRPQYIYWLKENSNLIEDIYTTKVAILQNSLNQEVYSDEIINAILHDLATEGQQIKQACKI